MWYECGMTEAQWREMLELAALASGFEIKFLEGTAMDICPYISARGGVSYESLEYKQEWNPVKIARDGWNIIGDVGLIVHLLEGVTKVEMPFKYRTPEDGPDDWTVHNYWPPSDDGRVYIERNWRPLFAITRAAAEVGKRVRSAKT